MGYLCGESTHQTSSERPFVPDYLEQRRRRWYAVLDVPKDVRPTLGKRFVKSLGTDSRREALRRVGPFVAFWKSRIESARNGTPERPMKEDTRFWREALRTAKSDEARDEILSGISERAYDIIEQDNPGAGLDPHWMDWADTKRADAFAGVAKGEIVATTEYLDEWLEILTNTQKTKDERRAAVQRFSVKFKTLADAKRGDVQRWINQLAKDGLSPPSIRKMLSGLRLYWKYLNAIEAVRDDQRPFNELEVPKTADRVAVGAERHPFEPQEVVTLLEAAKGRGDSQLVDTMLIAMWTGCRIEEICALPVDRAGNGVIDIRDAKTKSGWRKIPVHSKLQPSLLRMIEGSKDGYVISGLTTNKYDDRSGAVGKRFGRLKKRLGHGPRLTFHSIRGTVATLLENAGVPENVAADILGHKKNTMSYGVYSSGGALEVLRKAIKKLDYPGLELRE